MQGIEATELMHDCGRAWAMRTSRDAPDDQALIWDELKAGRLRQGWGYAREQDLAQVLEREKSLGRESLTEAEREAWRHARFAGSLCDWGEDEMRERDFVLIPNMPTNGVFSICRITGPYRFEIMPGRGDFGHIRPVELLTSPQGVSNAHPLVSSELARSLRSRSRLWWIGNHHLSLAKILAAAEAGEPLQIGSPKSSLRRLASGDTVGGGAAPRQKRIEWKAAHSRFAPPLPAVMAIYYLPQSDCTKFLERPAPITLIILLGTICPI